MVPFAFFFVSLWVFPLAGCGSDPTPRLGDLVGKGAGQMTGSLPATEEWTRVSRIGLAVHSDATGQNAAPVITPEYLETLTRRTVGFLRQRCPFKEIVNVPLSNNVGDLSGDLKTQGRRLNLPFHVVVVLSSREHAGPEKIGEATMMTQMSGRVVENSAMAELGVFRVSDGYLVFQVAGRARESLEQLDVPIGENQPSAGQALDILRAQAGQQALDRALEEVGAVCRSRMSGAFRLIGSFQIASRGRSPVLSNVS